MSTTADQYCCRCRRLCQGHRYQAGGEYPLCFVCVGLALKPAVERMQEVVEQSGELATLRAEIERLTKLVNSSDSDNATSNDAALELLRKALGTRDVHGLLDGIERLTKERDQLRESAPQSTRRLAVDNTKAAAVLRTIIEARRMPPTDKDQLEFAEAEERGADALEMLEWMFRANDSGEIQMLALWALWNPASIALSDIGATDFRAFCEAKFREARP